MLRTTLAAVAMTAVLASVGLADCGCGGGGFGRGSGGYAANAWDGYCGCDGNACGGCNRCCFPLIQGTLRGVGRVLDALIPDPCCRRSCGAALGCGQVGCAQPACGIEPGCGIVGPGDPFIDDHYSPPKPTPAADPHARARALNNARMMNHPRPKPALKPIPMRTAAAPQPKRAGKSVLKVAYDEETVVTQVSDDAPPAAPASIRSVSREPARLAPVARVAAKPVVQASNDSPVNPLR